MRFQVAADTPGEADSVTQSDRWLASVVALDVAEHSARSELD
jgi:hypothetical protein